MYVCKSIALAVELISSRILAHHGYLFKNWAISMTIEMVDGKIFGGEKRCH